MEWQDFVGNEECIGRLQKLLREKRMPGALLLVGPQGVGKFLAAEMVAAAIFFGRPLAEKAAGHPDMIIIQPDGQNIKIEQIRKMQAAAALAPDAAERRVIIIDEADKMTVQAANSLLKTLEEPPGEAMFILTAASRSQLLSTVVSRCQLVEFQPIDKKTLTAYLAAAHGLTAEQAYTLAVLSGGSLGRALQLQQSDALAVRSAAAELMDNILRLRRGELNVWQLSATLAEKERSLLALLLEAQLTLWRDLLVLASGGRQELLFNIDMASGLSEQQAELTAETLFGALELTKEALQQLKANGNALLIIERLLIKIQDL